MLLATLNDVGFAQEISHPPAIRLPDRGFLDPTTAQRYEIKFWATEEQAVEILRICQPHMELDPFCLRGPQRNVSLYLDSPQRTFLEQHLSGAVSRFKLRVRTYEDPTGLAFLEVKRRVKTVTSKLRTPVRRQVASDLVDGRWDAVAVMPPSPALGDFLFLCQRYLVEPVLLVSARRLALRTVGDEGGFRLTLDRDIRYQRSSGPELVGRPGNWTPVSLVERTGNEALRVLLEMKFADAAPAWVAAAIEGLHLRPTSYSKYVAAMCQDRADFDGGECAMGFRPEDEDGW